MARDACIVPVRPLPVLESQILSADRFGAATAPKPVGFRFAGAGAGLNPITLGSRSKLLVDTAQALIDAAVHVHEVSGSVFVVRKTCGCYTGVLVVPHHQLATS